MLTLPKPERAIQMVDLQRQYESIKQEIDAAIREVLTEARFVKGAQIGRFEANLGKYLNIEHVIGCANGTDALQMALMALDLKPGDEVITAAFTFISSAEVIAMMGLTPVLADVDSDTFCMDPAALEASITPKTKAIIPVHLFGQTANMERILEIAAKHSLYVIEDAAQAIGAKCFFKDGTEQSAGGMGHFGTTSFFPSKNLACYGDGGAVFTNDAALAQRVRMIANHGQSAHYVHDIVGLNSRLDTLQAAILGVKLKHLNSFTESRQSVAETYTRALEDVSGLQTPKTASYSTHVYHQYTLKVDPSLRDGLKQYLGEQQIPTAIYYQTPLHRQHALKSFVQPHQDFTRTDTLSLSVLSLPMSPDLDSEQLDYIIYHIKHFIQHKS